MRKSVLKLHVWLGIFIGLLWAVQGLTGALLVFHRDADRLLLPATTAGPLASLDVIVARARAASSRPIERIGIIDARGDLLAAEYRDLAGQPRALLVDAASTKIVGTRELAPGSPATGSFSQWLYLLHQSFLRGEDHDTPTGLSGLLLIITIITGLWIAWPPRGKWRKAFAWRGWRSVDQQLFGWHRATGLLIGFILLITVPCGIYMVFAAEIRPRLADVVAHRLPFRVAPAGKMPARPVGPDIALAAARKHFPNAAFVSVAMPKRHSPLYVVRLRQPAEPRLWAGVTSVAVDAASGRTLDIYDPLKAPFSNRVTDIAFAIHNGEAGGLGGRALILLVGLSLPFLYVLGCWAWWRKKQRRKRHA
jgi:uncharacterized iron-regulated membrane protein